MLQDGLLRAAQAETSVPSESSRRMQLIVSQDRAVAASSSADVLAAATKAGKLPPKQLHIRLHCGAWVGLWALPAER